MKAISVWLNICYVSPATCTLANLPSSMVTSPVTQSSFNTMASSRLAQVETFQSIMSVKLHTVQTVHLWCSDFWFLTVPVAPDTINNHVKTCREEQKSLHFFAPEYGGMLLYLDSHLCFLPFILILIVLIFAFSCCQCHHSCGYLFLWNVRLRGERSLVLLKHWQPYGTIICLISHALNPQPPQSVCTGF